MRSAHTYSKNENNMHILVKKIQSWLTEPLIFFGSVARWLVGEHNSLYNKEVIIFLARQLEGSLVILKAIFFVALWLHGSSVNIAV